MVDYDKISRAVQAGKTPLEYAAQNYVIAWKDAVEAQGRFAQVRYAGGAFTMVRREAVERMCAAYPELQYRVTHARGQTQKKKRCSNASRCSTRSSIARAAPTCPRILRSRNAGPISAVKSGWTSTAGWITTVHRHSAAILRRSCSRGELTTSHR
jgi:hypothetical protein